MLMRVARVHWGSERPFVLGEHLECLAWMAKEEFEHLECSGCLVDVQFEHLECSGRLDGGSAMHCECSGCPVASRFEHLECRVDGARYHRRTVGVLGPA